MKCPGCGNLDTRVIDSREAEDGDSIRRRRVCDRCEERFTTFERSESARIQVLKRDGSRQEFDRRKLASAIGKAASKGLAADEIDRLIDELEAGVRQSGVSEIPSGRIGEMVLERLAERDPLSYLRFKIVYSRIEDIDALYDELASLVRIRQQARDRRVAVSAHGGPPLAYEKVGELTGLPLDAMFRLAWPDIGATDVERYRVEYRTRYDAVAIPATRLYRGARTTLRDFHSTGLLQATVTGKRAADCERILRGLGIKKDIDVYLGGDSAPRPKPAPDLAQFAMTRLRVSPEESVVVGDSAADIAMGKSAGAHTIQVLWGFSRSPLPDADQSVRTWGELRAAVLAPGGPKPAILGRRGALRS